MAKKKESKKPKSEKAPKKPKNAESREQTAEGLEKASKESEPGKDRILVYGIVLLLVIFGAFIFGLKNVGDTTPEVDKKIYEGYIFQKEGDIWFTRVHMKHWLNEWEKDFEIMVHYTPDEVEDIPTIKNSRNESVAPSVFLDANQIYVTMDPEYPSEVALSAVEIVKIIGIVYEKKVNAAITRPYEGAEVPVITCEDLGPYTRVIHLELANTTRIYSNKGCIVVQGTNPQELLKASERLTYEMLKIL